MNEHARFLLALLGNARRLVVLEFLVEARELELEIWPFYAGFPAFLSLGVGDAHVPTFGHLL